MPTLKFAVLAGDYIGPEVMTEALRVLEHVAKQENLTLAYTKADVGGDGIDIVCIRELTGGVYFGQPKTTTTLPDGDVQAIDTMVYRKSEIERITDTAIATARARKKKLCSIDKANVLETSVLWRKTVTDYVTAHAPEIQLSHMYVDNAAMQLARDPNQFD